MKMHATKPAAWIEATGEDSFPFLQGQCTNDLRRKEPQPVTYTLWLDRKGRVLADSFVFQETPERFFLFSAHGPAPILLDRLEPYIIADDVELADRTGEATSLIVWGEELAAANAAGALPLPEPGTFTREGAIFFFRSRRSTTPQVEIVALDEAARERMARIRQDLLSRGAEEVEADALETERVSSALPSIPADIGPAELPQEAGLENLAISFTKGCYLGQEVMARIHSMGQVRRVLVQVRIEMPDTPIGATLFAGEKEAGVIKSIAPLNPGLGLALIRREAQQAGGLATAPGAHPSVFPIRPTV